MFDFLLVVLTISSPILVIVFISRYFKYKSETQQQLLEMNEKIERINNKQLESQVSILQERVETLERIVTDESYELSQKISQIA